MSGKLPAIRDLPAHMSSRRVLCSWQRRFLAVAAAVLLLLPVLDAVTGHGVPVSALVRAVVVAALAANLVRLLYLLWMSLVAWRVPSGCPVGEPPPDSELPTYTVLVPLYREDRIVPRLVEELAALDYPPDRLQILLLIEADDHRTLAAAANVGPPFEIVVIPADGPQTKPKACNVGLSRATGELCTIYDAEDRPDPDQLRRVATAFLAAGPEVVCIQAELHYWNPHTNWLTAQFTAEYALRFRLTVHGLERLRLPIPLGGTSNHFRARVLAELGGWDPYNVTEDADLGIRIARRGGVIHVLPSTTNEEANSRLGNWLRQRSRWCKGHIQTWLVHMRAPRELWRELGPLRFAVFHIELGLPLLTSLLNPFLWVLALLFLIQLGGWAEAIAAPIPVELGLVVGTSAYLVATIQLAVAARIRGCRRAAAASLTAPVYAMLVTVGTYKGLFQLIHPRRRHYWEHTEHGLVDE
ncbi:glycosyltransferase [Nocardia sp. NPDC024068]|uniref:glycosyltransferase n=1 Tax=Nocardia sp. NPDC024068 TaxID=3157197 RepID=UPI0033C8EA76